jgi:hypothetical protein
LAGTGAVGVASASAATARLDIYRWQDEYGVVYNQVVVNGSASTWNPFGGHVEVRLWGDDQWNDDLLKGPERAGYFDGLSFSHEWWVTDDELDEDWDGTDEIYAGVRIFDEHGNRRETAETNRVRGSW